MGANASPFISYKKTSQNDKKNGERRKKRKKVTSILLKPRKARLKCLPVASDAQNVTKLTKVPKRQ